jgi:tartrate dehydrogenase/decarboxylase/D-malate dehydrogenase
VGAIWAGALMLDHLGEREVHDRVLAAVTRVLDKGDVRTPDLGGKANTADVATAVRNSL